AIGGEIRDGALQWAEEQVHRVKLDEEICVRKGNGVEVIEKGEVNGVRIGGMGGALIGSTLNEGKHKFAGHEGLSLEL
ncbi:tRNA (adenine(22)-N(1))-methyltransferase TrmK, partial [Bacillus safensis]|uniref:tRNA (adenine(22)-N(1))-methyltransferase TrmK n=1 Tax=Bacillus safensis TaxID=561879 RepID=UPI0011A3C98C